MQIIYGLHSLSHYGDSYVRFYRVDIITLFHDDDNIIAIDTQFLSHSIISRNFLEQPYSLRT